jgi:hypothetical protein
MGTMRVLAAGFVKKAALDTPHTPFSTVPPVHVANVKIDLFLWTSIFQLYIKSQRVFLIKVSTLGRIREGGI